MAGFRTANGRELALARDGKWPTLYLSDGEWLERVSDLLSAVDLYPATKSRSNALAPNAPSLGQGNRIVKVNLDNLNALEALCDAYEGLDELGDAESVVARRVPTVTSREDVPLNQILYGPPGTARIPSTKSS